MTKKDQSMQLAINSIRRLEGKIEELTRAVTDLSSAPRSQLAPGAPTTGASPDDGTQQSPARMIEVMDTPQPQLPVHYQKISFSQHAVLHWPAVAELLPHSATVKLKRLPNNYAVHLERSRTPLSSDTSLFTQLSAQVWLNGLPMRIIEGLVDAFFSTFNGLYPVLDRRHFYSVTMSKASEANFNYSIESTTVLLVLALGCIAMEGYREGDFSLDKNARLDDAFEAPDWHSTVMDEQYPGLSFFNEARKRMGFRTGSNNLYNCQVYLLCALYYTQILRPIDSYLMLVRAASCSLMTLTCSDSVDWDTWEGDMEARLFWVCLMHETILVQELEVPKSGLLEFESTVPLPSFKPFRSSSGNDTRHDTNNDEEDAFFHYHFLAQAANRIMMTRISTSHYFYDDQGLLPSSRIHLELFHQIEQWKNSLPSTHQFDAEQPMSGRPASPGYALAEALLRSRYQVIHFHLGRPYLYKALHSSHKLTSHDISTIKATWRAAMNWSMVTGICKEMKSVMLLKFGWTSQLFGQLVMMYCFVVHHDIRLVELLPVGWRRWWTEIMDLLEYGATHSPTVAMDLRLAKELEDAIPFAPAR
jgi:hypothetical protein